ncbi:MAG: DUF3127 domain-containing protein [Bacteroidales bacterium]|nr:DUF3127 domain-containing protein [Bacteroidales bacterium]
MSFEVTGIIKEIFETQHVSDRFRKREFVIEIRESTNTGTEFVDYIKFQATQERCALLDQLKTNDPVKIGFNLRGRKWEKDGRISYFTNLDAWRIEKVHSESPLKSEDLSESVPDVPFPEEPPQSDPGFDDLPF